MSLFSETMTKVIGDYRFLLRRHLPQAERMIKLQELKLKREDIYSSDIALFEAGTAIADDLEKNMLEKTSGYYAYSGIAEFCKYLKEFLSHYYVEKDQVVHRAQKASRALLQSIQLTALPRERLDETIAKTLANCNTTVAGFGSIEQCELQLQTLSRNQTQNPDFYADLIAQMESLMTNRCSDAARSDTL